MTKRLFLAIQIPARFKKQFLMYAENYKNVRELRWATPENMHITVYFIGGIQEDIIPLIQQRLEDLFSKTESFNIEFEDIVYGPPGRNPRMIWAVFKDRGEYKNLLDKVYEILKDLSIEDNRANEAIIHITLARFKDAWLAKSVDLQSIVLRDRIVSVTSCDLIESKLSPKGPSYTIIKRFNFKQ